MPDPHPEEGREVRWNARLYESRHSFVWKYGEDLLDLLKPQPGERILDLGCGTGQLTARIASAGAAVLGIDSSPAMIEQARHNYPDVGFEVADAAEASFREAFDAVFSNAALHWMKPAARVANNLSRALRPGGRLVAEFGGKGNLQELLHGVHESLAAAGCRHDPNPWYFPSLGEYASLLEAHGLSVTFATLFDRPTPLDDGEAGLRQWMRMFGGALLSAVPPEQQDGVLQDLEHRLQPRLYKNGAWVLDCVRLRIVAVRKT